ncbi:MAG: pyruvate formate lyase family protein [Victivallaceae bacterium]|nr:pyruvate formate lyase family protein [Victivallaceae bacterium]
MNRDEQTALLRTEILNEQLNRKSRKGDDPVIDARSLQQSSEVESWRLRRGMLVRDRLVSLQFQSRPGLLLAGSIKPVKYPEAEIKAAADFLRTLPDYGGLNGHCEPWWEEVFKLGLDGLIRQNLDLKNRSEGETAATYQSFIYALEGLSAMIEHAAPSDELCRKIAHKPPESFREAIQLIWFVMLGIMIGDQVYLVGPGRLDIRLNPFYQQDLKKGNITADRALELIEELYFLINDFDRSGLAYAVMVGGRDAEGNDLTNDLSYLCLEALRRTGLVYPTVGVCWHKNTPDALSSLAVELIAAGYTTPAFFNDEVIQQGLRSYGVPTAESWDYINSTCVEITLCGSSNIWVASPYFNLCQILLDTIGANGRFKTYEAFTAAYCKRLKGEITEAAAVQNELRERRRLYGGKPLQSVFTRDCMARGRDIDNGGARYNWVECSFVGLANLIDSLTVIREEVFRQNHLNLRELKHALDTDFVADEALLKRIVQYPKYGQDNSAVDREVSRIVEFIVSQCTEFRMRPDNSPFVPGTFCWIMHQRLGADCGTTPDGRRAGFPFADGAGPAQGREKFGPTAAVNSVTSWKHTAMIGGSAFNMKFSRALFDSPEMSAKLKQLIIVFLKQGGFETQINVVDNSTLKAALVHPEQYHDLVVRIGGYTDYFTRLSPEMQREILQRTEYQR